MGTAAMEDNLRYNKHNKKCNKKYNNPMGWMAQWAPDLATYQATEHPGPALDLSSLNSEGVGGGRDHFVWCLAAAAA